MLISAVLPIMSLYRLPHGQYGYGGFVINLPQDISSFAISLPRLPSELDVKLVRKEEATQSHRDFRVRRSIVLHALQWLLADNIYYRNIRIDPDALAVLPEDGDFTGLCSVTVETKDQEQHLLTMMPMQQQSGSQCESASPSSQLKLHQLSCGPPVEELLSMSLRPRATSCVPYTIPRPVLQTL